VGDAPRSAFLSRAGALPTRALGTGGGASDPEVRVLPVRRRAAPLHREQLCDDGSDPAARDGRAAVPRSLAVGGSGRAGTRGDAAAAPGDSRDPAASWRWGDVPANLTYPARAPLMRRRRRWRTRVPACSTVSSAVSTISSGLEGGSYGSSMPVK